MNEKPLVSVLMPVYNAAAYLNEAIESVLSQTYTHFEFVIIDDGSTDKSLEIIKSYKDTRIKCFESKENIKLIATLNNGLTLAQGTYIARIDADDIMLPKRLEKQVHFMETHPEVGLCGSFVRTIGLVNNYDVAYQTTHDAIKFRLFFDTHFPHPAAMMRKSVVDTFLLQFEAAYIHAEDFAMWNKMAEVTKLAIIPEVLVYKRCHEEQISSMFTDTQHLISKKIRKELINALRYEPTEAEMSVYEAFLIKRLPENFEQLSILLNLFEQLIIGNRQVQKYNPQLFESYFAEKYWDLCCLNTRYGLKLYQIFIKSEIKKILNQSFFTTFKFFIKSLFKV